MATYIKNSNRDKHRKNLHLSGDIALSCDGKNTTFQEEIAKRIRSNQSRSVDFNIVQDVMVVSHDGEDSNHIVDIAEARLIDSDINWNILSIKGYSDETNAPEIFRYVKFTQIVKAARSAGILKSEKTAELVRIILLLTVCCIITGLYYHQLFKTGLQFTGIPLLVGGGVFTSLTLLYFIMKHFLLQWNSKLRETLLCKAKAYETLGKTGKEFTDHIAEIIIKLDMPLSIIVNNVSKLDSFTNTVIQKILRMENQQVMGWILWICLKNEKTTDDNTWFDDLKLVINKNNIKHQVYNC